MDFIEQLPPSSDNSYTAILVVVDHFTKQSIFIPTFDTITFAQLAQNSLLFMYSPSTVFLLMSHLTADPNLYPTFSGPLAKP